jgi:tetratricopeptide (TPR) repeat protein
MRETWCALALSLYVFSVVVGGSTSALAQETSTDEAARQHFRLGQAHYDNGQFPEAAVEFEAAYRLSQRPQLLYNIYVSYRDAGEIARATETLRSYLQLVPDAENATQLRARLAVMEHSLAHGTTPATETAPSTEAVAPTEPVHAEPTPEPSETATALEEPSSEPSPDEQTASSGGGFGSSPVGWIIGGVGVAAIVAGVITGAMAIDSHNQLDAMCGPDHHSCPAGFQSTRDLGAALGAATDGLLIGGGVALATGVVLLFMLSDGGSSSEQPPVSASCGPNGCAAFVQGTF